MPRWWAPGHLSGHRRNPLRRNGSQDSQLPLQLTLNSKPIGQGHGIRQARGQEHPHAAVDQHPVGAIPLPGNADPQGPTPSPLEGTALKGARSLKAASLPLKAPRQ